MMLSDDNDDSINDSTSIDTTNSHYIHIKLLADLSLPMIANALIQEIQYAINMIFVGQLGNAQYLGAATLGNMLCNITGYSLAFGMCSALDTLISQAYGAKKYELMGIQAQRAAVILTLFSIPIGLIWCMTHLILYYGLGIDRDTVDIAGQWARYIIFGLWPTLMFQILKKVLQGGRYTMAGDSIVCTSYSG